MPDYKTVVTIQDSNQLILTQLPFQKGARVEVVLRFAPEKQEPQEVNLRQLLAETQALPQLQNLTDEEIMAEIAEYRQGL